MKAVKSCLLVVTMLMMATCCSDEDKEELKKEIDETFDKWRKDCKEDFNEGTPELTTCLQSAYTWYGQAKLKYIEYVTACDADQPEDTLEEIIRDIFKEIPKKFLNAAVLSPVDGSVTNVYGQLPDEAFISAQIEASYAGGSSLDSVTEVDGTPYLPEAAGEALRLLHPSGSVTVNSLTTGRHSIDDGAVVISSQGVSMTLSASGHFTLSELIPAPSGWRGLVHGVSMKLEGSSGRVDVSLDRASPFNDLVLDASGVGSLRFLAVVEGSGDLAADAAMVRRVWVTLPVEAVILNDVVQSLELSTGTSPVAARSIAPRLPSPIADFDGDGDADAADQSGFLAAYGAGDVVADIDGDGSFTSADLDRFREVWNDEQ